MRRHTRGRRFSAIGRVSPPVIDHVVPEIHIFAVGAVVAGAVQAGVAAVVVGKQVVVEAGSEASPDPAIATDSLVMHRIAQALGDKAPLHREVVVVISGRRLIDGP